MKENRVTATENQEAGDDRGVMPAPVPEIVLLSKREKTERLSKSYELDASGELKPSPAPDRFSDLTATRVPLDAQNPLDTLAQVINRLGPHQALAMGRLPAGVPERTEVPIVFAGQTGKGKHGTDWVRRTGQDFTHAKGVPAPVLLDFDVRDYPPEIGAKVDAAGGPLEALLDAVPELRDVKMVVRPSTSSGIRRKGEDGTGTGDPFKRGGLHAYAMLSDGSDAPRLLKTIQDRLWEKGLGFHKIAKNGTPIKASIIDASVGRPERPCYEAPPALGEGLVQDARPAVLRDWTVTFFDSHGGLAAADAGLVGTLLHADLNRPEVQERIKVAEDAYLGARVAKGVPLRAAQASLNSLRLGKLPLDTEIILNTPMPGRRSITVLDLLEDPQASDGKPMADPVEGTDYGFQTAKFFANDGIPKINTNAHGGGLYDLSGYGPQDAVAAVLSGLALDRVVRVLGLLHDDVKAVLRALDAEGTKVDAGLRAVAPLIRRAKTWLDFGMQPLPGEQPLSAGLVEGLVGVAAGKVPVAGSKDVWEWLEVQGRALAEHEEAVVVVLLDEAEDEDGGSNPVSATETALPDAVGCFDPLGIPGLVGEITRWGYETSQRDTPVPALAAALVAVSGAVGTAFRYEEGDTNYANIYANLCAPTGAGKGEAKRILKLTVAVMQPWHLFQTFRSQPAMHNAFLSLAGGKIGNRVVYIWDELGQHLKNSLRGGDLNRNEAATQIVELFNDYLIPEATLAGKPRGKVEDAFLTMIGMSQPSVLASGLSVDAMADGTLTRPLWFFAPFADKRRSQASNGWTAGELPQPVRDGLEWLYGRLGFLALAVEGENFSGPKMLKPVIVLDPTEEAVRVMQGFDDACEDASKRAAKAEDGTAQAIYSRAFENAKRVAVVIAAGEAALTPSGLAQRDKEVWTVPLSVDAARAAVGVAEASLKDFGAYAGLHIGLNEESRVELRILRAMGRAAKKGKIVVHRKQLIDQCKDGATNYRTMTNALDSVLDRGWLEEVQLKGSTKSGAGYSLTPSGKARFSTVDRDVS